MDITSILVIVLLFTHFMGLVLGVGSGIALGVVGPMFGTASGEQRGLLFRLGSALARNSHVGLGLLWVSGPLLVWLKWGGFGGLSPWFWVKLALVVALSASIGIGAAAYRKWSQGDNSASGRVALAGRISSILSPLIILVAILAFE